MSNKVEEGKIVELMYSEEYSNYIMENSKGDRIICNGDMLIEAMEDCYLFDDFLDSIGIDWVTETYYVTNREPIKNI